MRIGLTTTHDNDSFQRSIHSICEQDSPGGSHGAAASGGLAAGAIRMREGEGCTATIRAKRATGLPDK